MTMSEVHKAITAHSQKQHAAVATFLQLENMREFLIDEAVELCKSHQVFEVDKLNEVTKQINVLAKNTGYIPTRKIVTKEMVMEYTNRNSTEEKH
jgi:hypothetical protein